MVVNPPLILVGPEDSRRLEAIRAGCAPRIDYRVVSERCQGEVRECYPSPAALRGPKVLRVFRSMLANMRIAGQVVRAAPAGSVIYSTGETWGLPVGLALGLQRRCHPAHVICGHRVYSARWLRLLRWLQPRLGIDAWICITSYQARLLRQALGPRAAPIKVVSLGIDTVFFDPAKVDLPQRRPYLLSVGAEMRNYGLLFDAVQGLDVEVLVKASSVWMAQARQELRTSPANVTLLAKQLSYLELRDLYVGAALVVVPLYDTSQAAGSTTILEAMAMGKPVVLTPSRGLPDGLVSGKNCVVVKADPIQLAEAITTLLNNPAQMEAIASNGRRFVLDNHSLEHHAKQISDILNA